MPIRCFVVLLLRINAKGSPRGSQFFTIPLNLPLVPPMGMARAVFAAPSSCYLKTYAVMLVYCSN